MGVAARRGFQTGPFAFWNKIYKIALWLSGDKKINEMIVKNK